MGESPTFLDSIHRHLSAYAEDAGVAPAEVFLRISLTDGTVLVTQGLNKSPNFGSVGWGLIEGYGENLLDATAVRESSVFKVEFQLATPAPPPIGFTTEAGEQG